MAAQKESQWQYLRGYPSIQRFEDVSMDGGHAVWLRTISKVYQYTFYRDPLRDFGRY